MLIVGRNLQQLIEQHRIVDRGAYDTNSLTLTLDSQITTLEPPESTEISYGDEVPREWIRERRIDGTGYLLGSGKTLLACSRETVSIPLGYFGFCQTKGSLARLFISISCTDGQIDAGFSGKITFEVVNLGPLNVRLSVGSEVGQLFIFKTSTKTVEPYSGRYQGAESPTVSHPGDQNNGVTTTR